MRATGKMRPTLAAKSRSTHGSSMADGTCQGWGGGIWHTRDLRSLAIRAGKRRNHACQDEGVRLRAMDAKYSHWASSAKRPDREKLSGRHVPVAARGVQWRPQTGEANHRGGVTGRGGPGPLCVRSTGGVCGWQQASAAGARSPSATDCNGGVSFRLQHRAGVKSFPRLSTCADNWCLPGIRTPASSGLSRRRS